MNRKRTQAAGFRMYLFPMILLLFAVHSFFLVQQANAADTIGKFTFVTGTVDVLRAGTLPAVSAKMHDPVMLKDVIRTKSNARAEITLHDNTIVRIAQRSRIDMSEYVSTDTLTRCLIELPRGMVQSIVEKGKAQRISSSPDANTFQIRTPNAVAGVRGTDFFVAYDSDVTTVLLQEGNVCVFNQKIPGKVVCLPPGFIVTITGEQPPDQPRKASDIELAWFRDETLPILVPPRSTPSKRGEYTDLGFAQLAENLQIPAEKSSPATLSGLVTEMPANITDLPLLIPVTEEFPETVTPEPPPPPPPSDAFGSNTTGMNIWTFYPSASDGSFFATLSGSGTLWTATPSSPVPVQLSGKYTAGSSQPHIWFGPDFYSYNATNGTNTTPDGGAFRGFVSGREIAASADALFTGLYVDPSGNAGFLSGTFSGSVSESNISMNGGFVPTQMGPFSGNPAAFYDSITMDAFSLSGTGSIVMTTGTNQNMYITSQADWGVSQMIASGSYQDSGNAWSLAVSGMGSTGFELYANLAGTQWSDNRLNATAAGYWADTGSSVPGTGIYIGETHGTFNPADHTWQAVTNGTWIGTQKLLQLVSTPAGQNTLRQVNIPAVEVGRTTLSGSIIAGEGSAFDYMSISMNDVIFLAPSTGQKPGIWATNSVTGQYDFTHGQINAGNITNAENMITISNGGNISAEFQFNRWNTSNNTWTGSVNKGTGNLNGGSYNGPVNFNGIAAGTHSGNSGPLSGTAAGIVQ
jgi:hypothetical protein